MMLNLVGRTGNSSFFEEQRSAARRCMNPLAAPFEAKADKRSTVLILFLARMVQIETACGEGALTQSDGIALTTFCEIYNPGGHDPLHNRIWMAEAVHVFDRLVIRIRHQPYVCRFKYRPADEFNYRGHRPPVGRQQRRRLQMSRCQSGQN